MSAPTVPLGAVASINPRLTTRPSSEESVAFLGMADVDAIYGTTTEGDRRPFVTVAKGYTPFLSGDLLVAKITPCFENGKIAQAKLHLPVGMGSSEFHVVRPMPALDARYALHLLRTPAVRAAGARRMTGSGGQRRVPAEFLESLPVRLPSLDEQRRIANILDRANDAQAVRAQSVALADELTQAIFREIFGDLTSNARGWSAGTVAEIVKGFETGKNVASDNLEVSASPWRVLKISAVTSLRFRPEESKPAPADHHPPPHHVVRSGDLLFSRANTSELIGATAFVGTEHDNLLLPDKLWRFVWADPAQSTPLFVRQLFQQSAFRREIGRRASGTSGSMQNISQLKVLGVPIAIPPIAARREFERRAWQVEGLRGVMVDNAHALQSAHNGLSYRAFQGTL